MGTPESTDLTGMGLEEDFPGLRNGEYRITSPVDLRYNCFAWVLGENHRWWEPSADGYWPENADEGFGVESFASLLKQMGFAPCENRDLESGATKIALFAADGEITHAARQLENGRWTSKLGSDVDIEHNLLAIEGRILGQVVACFRRVR